MPEDFQGDSWSSIPPLRMSSLLPHDFAMGGVPHAGPQYTTVPLNILLNILLLPSGSWLLSFIVQACSCFRTTLLVPSAWNTFSRSPHDWLLLRSLFKCHLWKESFSGQSVLNISPSTTTLFHYLLFFNVIYFLKLLLEYNWCTMLCFRCTAKWTCYTNTYIHLF